MRPVAVHGYVRGRCLISQVPRCQGWGQGAAGAGAAGRSRSRTRRGSRSGGHLLRTTADAIAPAIARATTAATALAIARVFGEFVWEAYWDGAGVTAGDRTRSRNRRGSRSGGCASPATAFASATVTGTASTVATAPAIARVFAEFVWGGKLGWRRSCGRGRDSEQEHTWEQERGLRGTCACGRVCDCDSGCHYGCDCACNRSCVRSTDDPRILLAGSSGTWRSIAVRGLASPGIRSSAGICACPPPRFAREAEQGTARAAGTDAGADAGDGGVR